MRRITGPAPRRAFFYESAHEIGLILGCFAASHPEQIYYCATGEEMPLYEPCKDRKDRRDI